MPSTYSTNLKIELMATGENSGTWGTVTNTNLGTALEQAIVGYGNPDFVTDANLTITLSDSNSLQAARALVLNVTSTASLTVTRELIVPTIQKQYIVQNNTSGSQSITVKTSGGSGVTIPNGKKMHVYVNGTDVVQMDDFALIFNVDNLTLDGNTLSSTNTNGNIVLAPNGNGDVQLDADTVRVGDSNVNVTITSNGTADLILNTNAGTNSGSITIQDGVDGNIIIAPNGNGQVQISNAALDLTTIEVTNIKAKDGTASMTLADSTGIITLSATAGTANGVAYLNGSRALTTGSALIFTGSNLGVGVNPTNAKLEVNASSGEVFRADASGGAFRIVANQTDILLQGSSTIQSWINGSETMRLTSTGLKSSIAGTNADPVFSYTSDTNTGIFFPAADKLGFVAGGGSDDMVLTTTGLGIGTNSPSTKLQATIASGTAYTSSSIGNVLTISNSTASGYAGIAFNTEPSAGNAGIAAINSFAPASGDSVLAFSTRGSATLAERMRLDSSGNLGLGVTPVSQNGKVFQIDGGAGAADIRLTNNATGSAINNGGLFSLFGSDIYLWNLENNFLSFGTNNIECGRFSSDGTFRVKGAGTAGTTDAFQVAGTAPASAMTLDSGGLLLLGATSSQGSGSRLQVSGSTQMFGSQGANGLVNTLSSFNTNSSGFEIAKIEFFTGANIYEGQILFSTKDAGGTMAERARFTSGGTFQTSLDASIYGVTVGRGAGAVATNTAVGANALAVNSTGAEVTAIGRNALAANTVSYGTAVGANALTANTTGAANAAFGAYALSTNTTGAGNSAFGTLGFGLSDSALQANTTGSYNSAFGLGALAKNTTASNNTAVGYQSLYSNNLTVSAGSFVTGTSYVISFVGTTDFTLIGAANNNLGTVFTATGAGTGTGTAIANGGASNTAVGYIAGYSNTTGYFNTFIGRGAGYSNTTGAGNTFVGAKAAGGGAGDLVTTGSKNTILGAYDGNQNGIDIRTLSNYIVLSDGDGYPAFWGLGGATGYMKLEAGRLEFPATQNASSNANTLDDYEEGIHAATITPESGSVTLDSAIDTLSYTKIGRQVTVTGLLEITSVSSPTGYFDISLPFPIGDLTELSGRSSGSVTLANVVSANVSDFVVLAVEAVSTFRVYLGDSNNVQNDSAQQLQTGSQIYVSFTYFA